MKAKIIEATTQLEWRVNTAGLLREIISANPSLSILARPIQIFGIILSEVGTRAAELNDPELNKLMARLALYAETDPYSEHYSKEITDKLLSFKSHEIN
jgi:hypothetical protein